MNETRFEPKKSHPRYISTLIWCTDEREIVWNWQIIFRFASIHGRACFILIIYCSLKVKTFQEKNNWFVFTFLCYTLTIFLPLHWLYVFLYWYHSVEFLWLILYIIQSYFINDNVGCICSFSSIVLQKRQWQLFFFLQ